VRGCDVEIPSGSSGLIERKLYSAWAGSQLPVTEPSHGKVPRNRVVVGTNFMLQLLCFLCLSVMIGPWTRASSCERVRLRGFSAAHGSTSSICVSLECSGPIAD
jgi:hypothetical protein